MRNNFSYIKGNFQFMNKRNNVRAKKQNNLAKMLTFDHQVEAQVH